GGEVNVCAELAGEVADGKATIRGLAEPAFGFRNQFVVEGWVLHLGADSSVVKVNDPNECSDCRKRGVLFHQPAKCGAVDTDKEPGQVELKHPRRRAATATDFTYFGLKVLECPMDAFAFPTGEAGM